MFIAEKLFLTKSFKMACINTSGRSEKAVLTWSRYRNGVLSVDFIPSLLHVQEVRGSLLLLTLPK